jgi:hypothetical protein
MCFKKLKIRLTQVRLIFIPIVSLILIGVFANGIRELVHPEWRIFFKYPILIDVLTWLYLFIIIGLVIVILYCFILLYWILTKFISIDKWEDALNELKKRD